MEDDAFYEALGRTKGVVGDGREVKFVSTMWTILNSGDFVTAATIADNAILSQRNASSQPTKWKRDGAIFAFTYKGEDYFPLFGLDQSGSSPLPELSDIIALFRDKKDGWGMALWFLSSNSYLDGATPRDTLVTDPAAVLAAARAEAGGILHG